MGAIAHQFGWAEQSDYDTEATVSTFLPILSEGLGRRQDVVKNEGIRTGRRFGATPQAVTREWAEGSVDMEVFTTGMGYLFKNLLGGLATTQPDATNSPTVYLHTFTPGDLSGQALTLQKGVDYGSTVDAYTYVGAKTRSAEFRVDQGGKLTVGFDFDCKEEEVDTALATASYASTLKVFHFLQGSLKKDSVNIGTVTSVDAVRIVNNLKDRWFLGGAGYKSEPTNQPVDELSGSFTMEYAGKAAAHTLWAALTEFELVLEFVGDVISDDETELFRITLAACYYDGETPSLRDLEVPEVRIPFSAFDPASGDAVKIEYQNTDTAYA